MVAETEPRGRRRPDAKAPLLNGLSSLGAEKKGQKDQKGQSVKIPYSTY